MLVQTSMGAEFLPGGGEYMPIDRFKDATDWVKNNGSPIDITKINSNGFPNDNTAIIADSGWRTQFAIPSSANKPGNYNIVWTGGGSTTINPGATSIISISGSGCTNTTTTVSGVACTAVVDYSGTTSPLFKITAVASGGPTSIQVYNANDAALIAAGKVCGGPGSKFASTVGANFGVIRDLNRSNANNSNVAFWSDRTPTNWFSYAAFNYFPSALVTSNAPVNTSGAQYTLAFTGFTLTDKAHVIFNPGVITPLSFTSAQTVSSGTTLQLNEVVTSIVAGMTVGHGSNQNALHPAIKVQSVNSGTKTVTFTASPFVVGHGGVVSGDTITFSPMLNINGTGGIPLNSPTGDTLGNPNTLGQTYANWSTATYDASMGVFMLANNSVGNSGLSGGWPPEVFTQCANEIGAHPWYVQPPYAADGPTDFSTQGATYVSNNLLPGLIPRFEPPNEVWNNGFFATRYADNKEYLRSGIDFDRDNWYGRAASQLFQNVSTVYGANRARYKTEACFSLQSLPVFRAISAASYNSGTGVVTATISSALPGIGVGDQVFIRGLTGTGSFASANGAMVAATGTSGTTLKYTIATGLTLTLTAGATAYAEKGVADQAPRLNSWEYVLNGGSSAYNWATDICPTGYYQSEFAGNSVSEIGWSYWYSNGASSGQQDTLVNNFLAGAVTTSFAGNLYWLQNTIWPGFNSWLTSYAGTVVVGFSMYEGGYGSNAGCGYSYAGCGGATTAAVTAVSLGSTTVLTVGTNAWNYICNTASLCTGGNPKAALSGFGGSCGLNGLDPAVLSATATTVTVNVNSSGFTGCSTGTATYDNANGSGGYVATFELGVKQNTNALNLQATELNFLQSFYSIGGRFPAEYDASDSTDWGKYNPDVYATKTPIISAVQSFQAAP